VKYKILAATVVVATSLTFASTANATLTISASSGADSLSATDPTNTLASVSGGAGAFKVNQINSAGVGAFGGSGELFDLGTLDISNGVSPDVPTKGGNNQLTISVTETGLTLSSLTATLFGDFTGSITNATVTRSIYLDTTNKGLATTLLGSTTGSGDSPYALVVAGLTGPFSLTENITITATGPGAKLSADDNVKVPEPVSLSLLGTGLIGLGMVRRRKNISV
jgi:hypothetical protein